MDDGLAGLRDQSGPQRAQEVGLTPESISEQAYYALSGGLTNEFYRLPNLRQDTIQVRYEETDRLTGQDLDNLYLTASDGSQIPLKSIATVDTMSFHGHRTR